MLKPLGIFIRSDRDGGIRCLFFQRVLIASFITMTAGQNFAQSQSTFLDQQAVKSEPSASEIMSGHGFDGTKKTETGSLIGSQSCSSVSCHGNPHRESILSSASELFFDRDKHQLGGLVLREKRSRDIAMSLNLPKPPWESRECLVCHAPGAIHVNDHNQIASRLAEGVGCESCHGPAEKWLSPHFTKEWKQPQIWSNARKAETGFRETKSLLSRVNACADCHVGNEGQFVSHDFIAAGHPRLIFEYSAFQSRMPVHWRRSDDRLRSRVANAVPSSDQSTFEATNWLFGQLVNADHELSILSAEIRNPKGVWPELAHYDCFACHHELSSVSWRQLRKTWDLKPGELAWGTWNFGLISESQPHLRSVISENFLPRERELRAVMSVRTVDRSKILPLVIAMKHDLNEAMQKLSVSNFTSDQLSAVRHALLSHHEPITIQGWDQSVQLYLAAVALDIGVSDANGFGNRVDPAKLEVFVRLRELLSYRTSTDATIPSGRPESPFRSNATWPSLNGEFELLRSAEVKTNRDKAAGLLNGNAPEVN